MIKKRNIFNPERVSPSYVPRLLKYWKRGKYDIILPHFDESLINKDAVEEMYDRIVDYVRARPLAEEEDAIYGYDTSAGDCCFWTVCAYSHLLPVFERMKKRGIPVDNHLK